MPHTSCCYEAVVSYLCHWWYCSFSLRGSTAYCHTICQECM